MHKSLAAIAIALFVGVVGYNGTASYKVLAEHQGNVQQNPAPAAQPADGPKVPADLGVQLRDFQLKIANANNGIMQLNAMYKANYDQLQAGIKNDNEMLAHLKKEALKALNLNESEWDVDLDRLVATKKPAPPPAAPASKPTEKPKQ